VTIASVSALKLEFNAANFDTRHYKGIGGFYDRNLTEFC